MPYIKDTKRLQGRSPTSRTLQLKWKMHTLAARGAVTMDELAITVKAPLTLAETIN